MSETYTKPLLKRDDSFEYEKPILKPGTKNTYKLADEKKLDMDAVREITKKFKKMKKPSGDKINKPQFQKESDLPRAMTIDTTTSITGTSQSKKPADKVFNLGGEVTIGKGSDYIKDLID
tara:strand:+ start:939 stop:1298 length:360 start_codon:yes stop_codon:yes gene_type:complete